VFILSLYIELYILQFLFIILIIPQDELNLEKRNKIGKGFSDKLREISEVYIIIMK